MIRTYAAVGAIALLGACAPTYVATPYVPGPQPIQRVGVADDSMPENLSAMEAASLGSNFGLVGALIDAGVQSSRQSALTEALGTISFDAEEELERFAIDALAQQGIQATMLPGPQRSRRVFLTDYPDAPEGVEAYFDLVLADYGYVSAGHGQPWRPTADAMVRLVSASNGRVLMENRIAYNRLNAPRGVITLPPNPAYEFHNREEMVTNPEHLANGIKDALQEIARTAANLIQ